MLELIPILQDGTPEKPLDQASEQAREVMAGVAQMYAGVGYAPPWTGYLAVDGETCVGTCAFKGPPSEGSVEIAYFSFPESEGKGLATRMASALVAIAREADPSLAIKAQTLPDENASTAVLRKLGFQLSGTIQHPEDGRVWEWALK